MNLSDLLKSMFGIREHPRNDRPEGMDGFEDRNNPHFYFGVSSNNKPENENAGTDYHDPENDPFRRGFSFSTTDPNDMFRHFDEMFRSFDEVFRSMGMAEFPRNHPALPSIEQPPVADGSHPDAGSKSESLRDQMLKRPDSSLGAGTQRATPPPPQQKQPELQPDAESYSSSLPPADSTPSRPNQQLPEFGLPSIFGRLFTWPRADVSPKIEPRLDADLDEEVSKGNYSKLFPSEGPQQELPPRGMEPHEHFRGVSVYTFKSADGKLEERRTYQDGTGTEEHTITRGLGDQTHTVTIKKTPKGTEERVEHFENMDERDKDLFERQWESPQIPLPRGNSPDDMFKAGSSSSDSSSSNSSLFKNLFGLHFPGFPKEK